MPTKRMFAGDLEIEVPCVWAICGTCDGEGKSSAYLGAFTGEDLHELGDEWVEDYCAGRFDRACPDCKGSGKVLEPASDERLTEEQRQAVREHEEYQAELAFERRMRERGLEW